MRRILTLGMLLTLFFGYSANAAEPTQGSEVATLETACSCLTASHVETIHGESCSVGVPAQSTEPSSVKEDAPLFSLENLGNLFVLIFLQAVLGFDNLLYISLESQRAPAADRPRVRKVGILIAIALRVILLFVMIHLLDSLTNPFFSFGWVGVLEGEMTFSSLVFLLGGVFIIYTAVKEISHMLTVDELNVGVNNEVSSLTSDGVSGSKSKIKSAKSVIAMIVLMNLVFSFDSILSALAITKVFIVLALAIIASGIAMLVLADSVSEFLEKNRKYEVLGMFILLIVGVVLLGEGGHVAHMKLLGNAVIPMSKSTFYFSIVVLVLVDIIQSGYQRKLSLERSD